MSDLHIHINMFFDLAWFAIERQNLGTFLENKVHKKSKLAKYQNTLVIKFQVIFYIEKWL
jgi:hypothetical protein